MVNTLGNLTLINLSKSQEQEKRNLHTRTKDYLNSNKKRFLIWCVYWSVMALIDAGCTYGIILICSGRVASGIISASSIVLILSYVAKVFSPVQDFGWFLNVSTQLMSKIDRLQELQPNSTNAIDTSKDSYDKPIEKITLKNVNNDKSL